MSLFDSGIRPKIDEFLLNKANEKRDYGKYWSASSAGYCMRKLILERLKVPEVKQDARKHRVFEVGHIFHGWIQAITKESGLSIAQELELQDEGLMVRGHIDDLILVTEITNEIEAIGYEPGVKDIPVHVTKKHLILYDYKTQNSRAFSYQKDKPMSHFHKMQVGTYMYMLRKRGDYGGRTDFDLKSLSEARILKISKDDLRMTEQQLMWTPALEKEVVGYWTTLNGYWKNKTLPKCTCADREGGFMAKEAYNPFFLDGEPCSREWAAKHIDLSKWKERGIENGKA